MSWQERLAEYRKLNDDNDEVMSLSTNERILVAGAMFAENRHQIIESLPKDLSEREFKRQLYYRTYGEHLPDDFLRTKIRLFAGKSNFVATCVVRFVSIKRYSFSVYGFFDPRGI
jgi:hypothetical protein